MVRREPPSPVHAFGLGGPLPASPIHLGEGGDPGWALELASDRSAVRRGLLQTAAEALGRLGVELANNDARLEVEHQHLA